MKSPQETNKFPILSYGVSGEVDLIYIMFNSSFWLPEVKR